MTQEEKRLQALQVKENQKNIAGNKKLILILNSIIVVLVALVTLSFGLQLSHTMEECEQKLYEKLTGEGYPFTDGRDTK